MEIIENSLYGILATSVNGQPKMRPMAFIMVEGGKLWSSTYGISGKIKEFQENNKVSVLFVDHRKVQLRIEGTVDISGGNDKKRELLARNPKIKRHFTDEFDSNLVHIEIIPNRIRWTEPGFGEYHEVELNDDDDR